MSAHSPRPCGESTRPRRKDRQRSRNAKRLLPPKSLIAKAKTPLASDKPPTPWHARYDTKGTGHPAAQEEGGNIPHSTGGRCIPPRPSPPPRPGPLCNARRELQ
eukprot:scaffold42158_cov30-Tisochrysis_lutea.AAC.3